MPVPSTGRIIGAVTGTLYDFPFSLKSDVYLAPGPMNSGTAWIISNPGGIGYPLTPTSDPLFLNDVDDLSILRGWFENANDEICYLILSH